MSLWTVAFEIVNFLIIVLILSKFLYKPVRRVMRERQDRIRAQERAAAEAESNAEATRRDYEEKLQALADEEKAVLAKARGRAEEEAQAILERARSQARAARDAAARRIQRQIEEGVAALQDQVSQAALGLVGQVAGSLGASALHAATLAEVDRLLGEIPEEERQRAGRMLAETGVPVHVAAAPALEGGHRDQLADLLRKHLGVDQVALEVAEEPHLIAGVEIRLKNLLIKAHWRDRLERFVAQLAEETK